MAWQALKIAVDARTADILGDALMELGALSVGIEDAHAGTEREQAIFGEPGEPPAGVWQESILSALFDADADAAAVLVEAVEAARLPAVPAHTVEAVPEQDWVRQTQAQFDPIKITDRLWIVPTWHVAPDSSAINLTLDPGLAFGTGSHPTTRLCLQWLEREIGGGETVLDYGCGSGILAIAAMKLGAGRAIGVDIDPQAIQASLANAAQNQVTAEFFLPDRAPKHEADVVVANILANPLKVLAPMLARAVRPGGKIALSGILSGQADEVLATYREWFDLGVAGEAEGWVCLAGSRR